MRNVECGVRNALVLAPPALLRWLPRLWCQVLFPGSGTGATGWRWSALALLILLPGVLLYPCMSFHLFEPDEGRYAEIPREMLVRGEWVIPYLQGEPYLDKPPLFYWLVMASYSLFGVHAGAARLVPALAVHGTILLSYLIGRRSLAERPAFWGALLLGLAPGFLGMGRLLLLDGLLTLWVTLALLAGFEATRTATLRKGWWWTAALACGLGVLTKGPVILILVGVPLWLYRRLTPGGCRIGWPARLGFAALVLAVPLPWFVAMGCREPEFLHYFFWEHNVVRFMDPFDHQRPIWFYGPIVLAGLLPGTLLLVPFVRFLLSGYTADAGRRRRELGFFLLAGASCVGFFSLSGCKLPTYVLPAFPPLALALGTFFVGSRWERSRWPVAMAVWSFALLVFFHYAALPWYAALRSPMGRPEVVADYCGDPAVPVVCYPRHCDSVGFYLARDDLRNFRSKHTHLLIQDLMQRPRTVVLLTHRHSLEGLRQALPPPLRVSQATSLRLGPLGLPAPWEDRLIDLLGETPLGLCALAVVERGP